MNIKKNWNHHLESIHLRFFFSLFQVDSMFLTPDLVASALHEPFELLRGFEKNASLTETCSNGKKQFIHTRNSCQIVSNMTHIVFTLYFLPWHLTTTQATPSTFHRFVPPSFGLPPWHGDHSVVSNPLPESHHYLSKNGARHHAWWLVLSNKLPSLSTVDVYWCDSPRNGERIFQSLKQ